MNKEIHFHRNAVTVSQDSIIKKTQNAKNGHACVVKIPRTAQGIVLVYPLWINKRNYCPKESSVLSALAPNIGHLTAKVK